MTYITSQIHTLEEISSSMLNASLKNCKGEMNLLDSRMSEGQVYTKQDITL